MRSPRGDWRGLLAPPDDAEALPPTGTGRTIAVAAALAAGAALAAALPRTRPRPPVVTHHDVPAPDLEAVVREGSDRAARLMPHLLDLRSDDPVRRRRAVTLVECIAAEGETRRRRALVVALRTMGGEHARLPLRLMAADPDPGARVLARVALLELGDRPDRAAGGGRDD